MHCPKCSSEMSAMKFNEIEYFKCSGCEGLWFNNLEHEILKSMKGSESIDTGDAKEGVLYDAVSNYNCPNCSGHMDRLVDKDQPHLWYEVCHSCYGAFFDAGEFRDYKEFDVFDFIASFFVKERK